MPVSAPAAGKTAGGVRPGRPSLARSLIEIGRSMHLAALQGLSAWQAEETAS